MAWGQDMPKLDVEKARIIRESQRMMALNLDYLHERISESRFEVAPGISGPYADQITGFARYCSGEFKRWKGLLPSGDTYVDVNNRLNLLSKQATAFSSPDSDTGIIADDERLGVIGAWVERGVELMEPMLPPQVQQTELQRTQGIGEALRNMRPSIGPETTMTTTSPVMTSTVSFTR